jgi:uncharacterized protein DUF547
MQRVADLRNGALSKQVSLPPSGMRLMNELLNRALGIDSRLSLNDALDIEAMPTQQVAQDLKRVVNGIKTEAFDSERQVIDYACIRNSPSYADLRTYTAQLRFFDPLTLPTDPERLTFWINLYNVLVVDAVIAFGIRRTIWEDKGFFRRAAYRIGGLRCSADEIEHGILRANRRPPYLPFPVFANNDPRRQWIVHRFDPRIHAAVNCASRSCPPSPFIRQRSWTSSSTSRRAALSTRRPRWCRPKAVA